MLDPQGRLKGAAKSSEVGIMHFVAVTMLDYEPSHDDSWAEKVTPSDYRIKIK